LPESGFLSGAARRFETGRLAFDPDRPEITWLTAGEVPADLGRVTRRGSRWSAGPSSRLIFTGFEQMDSQGRVKYVRSIRAADTLERLSVKGSRPDSYFWFSGNDPFNNNRKTAEGKSRLIDGW